MTLSDLRVVASFVQAGSRGADAMRRGFTIIELLCVIAIVGLLAALMFPVAMRARERALETVTVSRLRQIGVALNLYRSQHDGADVGTPPEMGLPVREIWSAISVPSPVNKCASPKGHSLLDSTIGFAGIGAPPDDAAVWRRWSALSLEHGPQLPFVGMLCHNSLKDFDLFDYVPILGYGVDAEGSLIKVRRTGFPLDIEWWIHK